MKTRSILIPIVVIAGLGIAPGHAAESELPLLRDVARRAAAGPPGEGAAWPQAPAVALRTSALQPPSGLHSAARGLSSLEDWRRLFPQKAPPQPRPER